MATFLSLPPAHLFPPVSSFSSLFCEFRPLSRNPALTQHRVRYSLFPQVQAAGRLQRTAQILVMRQPKRIWKVCCWAQSRTRKHLSLYTFGKHVTFRVTQLWSDKMGWSYFYSISSELFITSNSNGAIPVRVYVHTPPYMYTRSAPCESSYPVSRLFPTLTLILLYPTVRTLSLNAHSFLRASGVLWP